MKINYKSMTTEDNNEELSYKQSGVDVEAGYELVQRIKPFVEKTKRPEIISGLGSFSALSRIPKHIKNPILVTCTDGVGTKIEIAQEMNNFGIRLQHLRKGSASSRKASRHPNKRRRARRPSTA